MNFNVLVISPTKRSHHKELIVLNLHVAHTVAAQDTSKHTDKKDVQEDIKENLSLSSNNT